MARPDHLTTSPKGESADQPRPTGATPTHTQARQLVFHKVAKTGRKVRVEGKGMVKNEIIKAKDEKKSIFKKSAVLAYTEYKLNDV